MRDLPDSKPAPPVGLPNKTHPNECIIHDPCAPPTLGDYLTQRIIGNGHTHEEVATELDTIAGGPTIAMLRNPRISAASCAISAWISTY
jgi:hypothetical protein